MTDQPDRFKEALARFDAANAQDPNTEYFEGRDHPKELLYAQRMTTRLSRYAPDASEVLQLAARAQHICRWKIPRNTYPLGRSGYEQWRITLANLHGDIATEIMRETGYNEEMCDQVKTLLSKDHLKLSGSDGQTLEDVICLVFLEFYFVSFAAQHDENKLTRILRRTWRKMSDCAHQEALALAPKWPTELNRMVRRAVG